MLVAALAVGLAVWLASRGALGPKPEATPPGSSEPRTTANSAERKRTHPEPPKLTAPKPKATRPAPTTAGALPGKATVARIGLVIDDLGRSLEEVSRLAALGVPVAGAVLPFEKETPQVAAALAQDRREILLHLPMDPEGGANPGPGALTEDMSPEQLALTTRKALAQVPGSVGVNNHMGSRLSADENAMRTVLSVIAERQLFFLDSRTSAESVAYRTARRLGMAAAERQVFLDPDRHPAEIHTQWSRLLSLARERGAAIAIGHPYAETFELLAQEIPKARAAGFEFVPVSYLMDSPGAPPE